MSTRWEDFEYYLGFAERQNRLVEWGEQSRKLLHNLELPFLYAGIVNVFIDRDSSDQKIIRWLHHGSTWVDRPYSNQVICNAIRLGLHGSLQAHHKNRAAVEKILKKVFADNWATQYQNAHQGVVEQELEKRVREEALKHK